MTSLTWVIWSQTSTSSAAVFERTSAEIKYAYMLNGIFIFTAVVGITLDSCRQARRYFQRVLALNQEIVIQEYMEKDDNEPTDRRRETINSQTLLTLSSRQHCHRSLSSAFIQDGGSFHTGEQQNHLFLDVIENADFVEIDLDNDEESNTTLLTDTDQSIEFVGNLQCLNDLTETCI